MTSNSSHFCAELPGLTQGPIRHGDSGCADILAADSDAGIELYGAAKIDLGAKTMESQGETEAD